MNQDAHIPRHLLETLASTQDPAEALGAREHVADCQTCTLRLEAITRARDAFLAAYPAERFTREVAARAAEERPLAKPSAGEERPPIRLSVGRRWFASLGAVAFALGALTLLFLRVPPREPDEIRLKGVVTWSVFAKRGTRTWEVSEGETLQAGDRLAFAYSLSQERYLLVLGIDDADTIVAYGPADATPLRLPRGQGRVPFAVELDARPGEEQLVALFSQASLDVAAAKAALAAAAVKARGQNRRMTAGDLKIPAEIVTFGFKKL